MAKEGVNALSVSKSSNDDVDEEEEEEELFQVKVDATHHYLESDSEEDRQKTKAHKLDSSKLKKKIEKLQKLRIRSDGEAKNTVGKRFLPYSLAYSLLLTHSSTYSLIHLHTHPLTHSSTHSLLLTHSYSL